MKERFDQLIKDFTAFVAEFSSWAKDKEGELTKEIEAIEAELKELAAELAKLQKALLYLGIGVGIGLPILAVAAACSGPLAPFVAVCLWDKTSFHHSIW
jgi:hypothetical protein